ncbi:syntaxin-18 isoform X1 [Corvus moneduloides]|uniref:Syntaxin 18 n=1 Tax=Corvus moneduloides TaxID=1196302 RepID=A0A8C3GWJ0_CORMO|nr:syntaxin-18 isoform X1 [Corvus moneduloides]
MAVDITLLFKASVKTVKTRNKALGVAAAGDSPRDELLKRGAARSKSDFTSRAREVISHIGKLKDFLLQHRKDYINAYSHIMSEYVRMTDTERDQIDQDAQVFMRTCADAIHQLRTEAHKGVQSAQVKEHRTAVLDFIEDYLKRVCKLYSEQRAIRVKRVIDKKRLSKLEPEQSNVSKSPLSPEKSSQSPLDDSEEKLSVEEIKDRNLPDAQGNLGLWGDGKGEDELSPEEIQMFEQENQRLIGEMNNLFDEVRYNFLLLDRQWPMPVPCPSQHPVCRALAAGHLPTPTAVVWEELGQNTSTQERNCVLSHLVKNGSEGHKLSGIALVKSGRFTSSLFQVLKY